MAEKLESNTRDLVLAVYECLCCEHRGPVRGKKEDYSEVKVCPNCNGAFVDTWKIAKYKQKEKPADLLSVKINVDCSESLKGLKAITRVAKKATAALKELEEQQERFSNSSKLTLNIDSKRIASRSDKIK